MYDLMMAMEISRIVHKERLAAAAQHDRLIHELGAANRLEIQQPLQQMRKMMNRVMSLFF